MTERERLTEILKAFCTEDCKITHQCGYCDYGDLPVCASAVADHLLANGVIVPPCKVGDKAYIVEDPYTFLPLKKVVEGEVVSIHLHEHGLFVRVLFDTKKITGCVDFNLNWREGKTVFLSREDAEKALKERSEGK